MNDISRPTTTANWEATLLSASELAEWLTGFANQNVGGLMDYESAKILEAARRLSRFVWIPTHEQMPEISDATDKGQVLVKWAGGTVSVHQWDGHWRRSFARASMGTAVAWSRIDNEPPEEE